MARFRSSGHVASDGGRDGCKEFAWRGHEEGAAYLAAVVSYILLGVLLRTVVLNWIVGPLYFVSFVWTCSLVLARRKGVDQ